MTRPSLLRSLQHWFLILGMAIMAIACGGRSDEGLLPPDLDASLDGASRGDGPSRDGAGGADGSIGGDVIVLPDGAIILPDGARVDGTGGAGGVGPADGGGGRLPDGGTTATLVRITVDPPVATLAIATNQPLIVTGVFSDGTTISPLTQGVTFASNAVGTANVSAAGVVTAAGAGMATITATRQPETLTASSLITVTAATLVSIDVTPNTQTIGVGGSINYTATGTFSDGTHQNLTTTVNWTSSDAAVASIVSGGLAQGVAAGMTTIKATMPVGGISGSATLTVTASPLVSIAITPPNPILPIGVNYAFKATATYANGMTGDVTNSVMWTSSSPAVGSIGAATGTGTTLAAGTSTITAALTQGGMMVTGTTTLTVTPATLVSITVTPAMSTVIVGGTPQQLTATGRFNNNTTLDITASVSWSSSNASSAFVSTAAGTLGRVSGLAAGMATITATMNTIAGTATVTVVEAKLVSITISPPAPSVPLGATVPLTASGLYDNGLMADVTALVTWSTDSAATASISNAQGTNGQVIGRAIGTTVAHAVSGAVSAQVTVTVTAAIPQTLEVTPANPSVQITRTQQMRATAIYTDASRVDVTTLATWSTGRAATASISNGAGSQGVATAVAVGTTTVNAAWSGLMGTTNITVTPAIPTSITVTPFTATIMTNATQAYTAVVIYDIGTQATVTGQCMWSSSDPAVATFGTGMGGAATATGRGGGMVTIKCIYTAAGVTIEGTAALTVIGPTIPVSLNITPDPVTVTTGGMVQLTATVTYDNMLTANVTNTSAWRVLVGDAGNVAGVTTAGNMGRGVVTGLAPGVATIEVQFVANGVTVIATATVTVEGTVTGLTLSPGAATLNVGGTQNYTVSALYSDGSSRAVPTNNTQTLCTSSDSAIATFQVMGMNRTATCLAEGTVTLTCTYTPVAPPGVTGTAQLECQSEIPTRVDIAPGTSTVALGTAVPYTATATYANGTMANVTANALTTWTDSSMGTIVSVNNGAPNKGVANTLAQGTVTITATFRNVTGTATLTVGPVAPVSLAITPTGGTLQIGSSTQYTALLLMSDGTTTNVTQTAIWTSSTPGGDAGAVVASVTNTGTRGVVAGVSSGNAAIRASYTTTGGTPQTFTDSVNVTVQ